MQADVSNPAPKPNLLGYKGGWAGHIPDRFRNIRDRSGIERPGGRCGGLGSLYAGRPAAAGHDVALLARSARRLAA